MVDDSLLLQIKRRDATDTDGSPHGRATRTANHLFLEAIGKTTVRIFFYKCFELQIVYQCLDWQFRHKQKYDKYCSVEYGDLNDRGWSVASVWAGRKSSVQ